LARYPLARAQPAQPAQPANRLNRLNQAEGDLSHSKNARTAGDYDWACFAAQQAAEKAVKGLILSKGGEGWGHSVMRLLKDLSAIMEISERLIRSGMKLDKHYIPTRYPNGFDIGAPKEYYTDEDAQKAIRDAQQIYDFCRQSFSKS
jgi:HEPN domain-containing protein